MNGGILIVGQFETEASQARDSGVAKSALRRASLAQGRLFATQKRLAQDDKPNRPTT